MGFLKKVRNYKKKAEARYYEMQDAKIARMKKQQKYQARINKLKAEKLKSENAILKQKKAMAKNKQALNKAKPKMQVDDMGLFGGSTKKKGKKVNDIFGY
jgi:hypothetical protein